MQKRIIIKIIFCLILFISAIAAIIIKLNSDKPKVGISRFELYCKTINVTMMTKHIQLMISRIFIK